MSNRLPILAADIRQAHADAQAAIETAADRALAAGAMLCEAKALCSYGDWLPFLKSAGLRERTAQRWMKLHRAEFKPAIVADLGFAQCEAWASAALAMRPSEGMARVAGSADIDGERSALTYWWKSGELHHYVRLEMIGAETVAHIISSEPQPAIYSGIAATAVLTCQNVMLVETQPAQEIPWLSLIQKLAPGRA